MFHYIVIYKTLNEAYFTTYVKKRTRSGTQSSCLPSYKFQAIMKQYPDKLKRFSLALVEVNPWRLLNSLDYNNGVCRLAPTTLYSGRGFLPFFLRNPMHQIQRIKPVVIK